MTYLDKNFPHNRSVRQIILFICIVICIALLTLSARLIFLRNSGQAYPIYFAILSFFTLRFGPEAGFATLGTSTIAIAYYLLVGEGFAVADPVEALGLFAFVGSGAFLVTALGAVRSRCRRSEDACTVLKAEKAAKAALLSELSHRIGNDLTMLMSLAELQMLATSHEETKHALTGLVDRMYVFGAVYKRLNVDTAQTVAVDMPSFLGGLCTDLRTAHLGMRPVSLDIRCEPSTLPAGRAALVGLVLNETITNALKHAFPDDSAGAITVEFGRGREAAGFLSLVVTDDGAGFDPSTVTNKKMGQRLLRALASQLQGRFTLERTDQLTIARLRFPELVGSPPAT